MKGMTFQKPDQGFKPAPENAVFLKGKAGVGGA